ncbi:MAG: cytochrome C, partial [Caldilineae bacterium]
MRKLTLLGTLVLVLVLLVAVGQALGKQGPVTPQVIPEQADEPPDPTENLVVPYLDEWLASAHADVTAEAFRHWDEDDPAEVPDRCAKCHTSSGYKDYLGADGSEPGVVEAPVPVGEVVACEACHNDVTATKDSVVMPSGLELT